PEGHLILGYARLRLWVVHFFRLHLVEIANGVETHAPHGAIHAFRVGDIEHRIAAGSTLHALKDGRQEAASPQAFATAGQNAAGDEPYETVEVLAFGAEPVRDPRSHRRPALAR